MRGVLAKNGSFSILSIVSRKSVDAIKHEQIAEFGRRVLDGGSIGRDEALHLFNLESSADIYDLLSWANRVREHFKGRKIHLCSIVNAKAGACSENCSFCAQSSFYQTGSPKYGFVDPEPVFEAADEAKRNGVTAVGLVAAWKGLKEGPMLDEVCERIRDLKDLNRYSTKLTHQLASERNRILRILTDRQLV